MYLVRIIATAGSERTREAQQWDVCALALTSTFCIALRTLSESAQQKYPGRVPRITLYDINAERPGYISLQAYQRGKHVRLIIRIYASVLITGCQTTEPCLPTCLVSA